MEMTRVEAIKKYFGSEREVTASEIMALRDKIPGTEETYLHYLGDGALAQLGATLKVVK